jgi:hypothetical protein
MYSALQDRKALYIKSGTVTPLALYRACYDHLHQPIVLDLDEMESLMVDTNGRRLLLALGETTLSKQLNWHSTTRRLGDTPESFETSSSLCIIANEPPQHKAIRSRATILEFSPTNQEVHSYAARWFWDQQIHDWIGRHLSRLHPLDLRSYGEAYSDRLAGRDWADLLLKHHALAPEKTLVQDLEHDPAYPTRRDKERRFVEIMAGRKGGSRANYQLHLRRLKKTEQLEVDPAAPIPVRGKRPPNLAGIDDSPEPPTDLPARDSFVRPIAGPGGQPSRQGQPRAQLDDSLPWDRPPSDDDE